MRATYPVALQYIGRNYTPRSENMDMGFEHRLRDRVLDARYNILELWPVDAGSAARHYTLFKHDLPRNDQRMRHPRRKHVPGIGELGDGTLTNWQRTAGSRRK